ncbi:MAG: metal-sensitive transcriptional regulator [Lentisphaeria bacterium]
MSLCGSDQDKERMKRRLHRIEGQIRGIEKMIDSEAVCIDVLRQINSSIGALRGIWAQVIGDHLKGCITRSIQEKDESLIDELMEHLKQIK